MANIPPMRILYCVICGRVSVNCDYCQHCQVEAQEVGRLSIEAQKQAGEYEWPTELDLKISNESAS